MRLRSKALVVIACALVLACDAGMSLREQRIIEQAVRGQFDSWVRYVNNHAADSVAALFHQVPELVVVWSTGEMNRGWDEARVAQTELFESSDRINLVPTSPQLQVLSPSFATISMRYAVDIMYKDGTREPRGGHATQIWMKDPVDDVWKIHLQHFSLTPQSEN